MQDLLGLPLRRMVDVPLGIDAQEIAAQAERRRHRIGNDPLARHKNHVPAQGREVILQQETDDLGVRFRLVIREKNDVLARGQLRRDALQLIAPGERRACFVHEGTEEVHTERVVVKRRRNEFVVRRELERLPHLFAQTPQEIAQLPVRRLGREAGFGHDRSITGRHLVQDALVFVRNVDQNGLPCRDGRAGRYFNRRLLAESNSGLRIQGMLRLLPLLIAFVFVAPQAPPAPNFAGLDAVVRKEMLETMTPGAAVAVVLGDRVILARGFGVANVETGEAVRPEMVFRLGSTTKMFTAATVVLLAEQGKLSLNEPIGKHIAGLTPKLAALTAHQLLSHTSGILDNAPMFGSHDESAMKLEVAGWKDDKFFTEPGKIYSYSNPGYWLAGLLAETVGGKLFADQVATSVFEALGMKQSTFRPSVAMTYPLAQGHDVVGGKPQIIRPTANNAASWPAGSIFTSVMDVSRWMMAFVNGGQVGGAQILPATMFATLAVPRSTIPGSTNRYGYGVQVGTWRGLDVVEHGGSRSGYGSVIRMVPSQKFGVVVLANRTGVSLSRTANAAMEAALKLEPAPPPTPRTAIAMTPAEAAAFAGVYSQGLRRTELVAKGAELFQKGPAGELKLEKVGGDELQGDGVRYFVVRSASGSVEYLHAGGRSWRKLR